MTENSRKRVTEFVPRILQLDAGSFDSEIKTLLYNQVSEVGKYLTPGTLDVYKSEINLLLNLLIFKYSLVAKNSTFGQDIFNLKYKNKLSSIRLTAFALLSYVLPYLTTKVEDKSRKSENKTIEKTAKRIQLFIQACTVLNLMVFLREGKYPTLVDRLLKLQYAPAKPINTHVGYNFMIKELLWHGIMMFLTNILPLVNVGKMKRKIMGIFQKKIEKHKEVPIILKLNTKCVVCHEYAIIPSQISQYCSHVGCYYCIKSNTLADDKFECPVCSQAFYGYDDSELTLLDWVGRRLRLRILF